MQEARDIKNINKTSQEIVEKTIISMSDDEKVFIPDLHLFVMAVDKLRENLYTDEQFFHTLTSEIQVSYLNKCTKLHK